MRSKTIIKWTFTLNVISLITTFIFGYLFISYDLNLTLKGVKIIFFIILVTSTISGFYLSKLSKNKPFVNYYLILIFSPIILILIGAISGNRLGVLYIGGQMINSTFGSDEIILHKNNQYVKRSFSLMSNQWYSLYESQGVFEKKIGQFNSYEDLEFVDYVIFDSINRKYIKLTDSNQFIYLEELDK